MIDKIKILLVEDSPEDVKYASIQLKQAFGDAHSLQTSDYFSKASKLIAENTFDVIILDLCLPDSRGLETFRVLANSTAAPIIIYSGLSDDAVKVEAMKAGACHYLIKGETSAPELKQCILGVLTVGG